ncbi:hypothetical protein EDC04DRAFT_2701482 [Pisolithus marmoratus]|nr:hypothetical protein EDC04DRAFT_2701482 [Pisolithus marmoratus]
MADRMSQYQMFSQNMMQAPIQQQQPQQQQAQPQMLQQAQQPQQPTDPQMLQGLPNTEAARMWHQLQNQPNQMQGQIQNSYRLTQSADLAAAQMNPQDYARGQAFSQGQGLAQQLQQPFGLNAQRFNPAFHDAQANQTQSFIPSNFMPANTPQMKPQFARGHMLQAPINNPNAPRQMQLMASQNQPNHQVPNGMDMARLQQAGFGVQPGPQQATDMFAMSPNPDQMHGSPHPSSQRMVPLSNSQAQVQKGQRGTIADYMEKYQSLKAMIPHIEQQISEIEASVRAGNITEQASSRLATMRMELNTRKQQFQMLGAYLAQVVQRMPNGAMSANGSHLNLTAPPLAQSHQQVPGSAPQQQSFAAQVNPTSSQTFAISSPGNGTSPMPAAPQNSAAATQQQISAQPGQMNRPTTLQARSVPTPHQLPSQAAANAIPPGMANGMMRPTNSQGAPQPPHVKPLDAPRFESTYAQFCRSQRMPPNMKVTIAENRVVDLHKLHVEVLQEGGFMHVTMRDRWAVIGGRLGWVQFAGSETDPPRCGPVIAQQLQHTYKEHLQQFESAYMMTVRNRALNPQNQHQQQQQQQQPPNGMIAVNGRNPAMPMAPTETQHNAHFDCACYQLRARGISQNIIDFIEKNRPRLIQWGQELARRAAGGQSMPNSQIQVPSAPDSLAARGMQRPPQLIPGSVSSIPVGEHKPSGLVVPPPNLGGLGSEGYIRAYFTRLKEYIIARGLDTMQPATVSDDQRPEYDQLLQQACKLVEELDNRLPTYWPFINNEEAFRKLAAMVVTVQRQRESLSSQSPQYIINLATLRNMVDQVQKMNRDYEQRLCVIKAKVANSSTLPNPPPIVPVNRPPPPAQPPTVPHSVSTPMISSSSAPPNPSPLLQAPPQPPVIKKPAQTSPSPCNPPAPTPPPAVSTPTTSAATPQTQTAGSPQAPKSPKPKVGIRSKVAPRVRKPSTSTKGALSPEAASAPVAGVKRPPQDETAALLNPVSSEAGPSQAPSPKKIRTEWEGEPSEALVKRQQQFENVKTEEDTIAFLDQMKELLAISARADSSVHNDIAVSLGEILAGVSQEPEDTAATAAALSAAREFGQPPTALSPHPGPVIDAFGEFFDFSSCTTLEDEESDSKAPTPELVPSAEANPSPESGSDADPLAGSPGKTKIEDSSDHIDLLRLGILRDIDGGEAAHYQSDQWKWEGTMQMSDQPWAMLTS